MPIYQGRQGTWSGGYQTAVFRPSSSGGGGGGTGLQDIIKQMQASQEKANLVNEQRYRDILGTFENLGQAGRARIQQQTAQRQSAATQGLISRGLGNTTITAAAERGIASDAELQRQQLEETVSVQKAGVMERRTDTGPDLGMFASLLQTAAQQQKPMQATMTRMGPMASAGRNVFGRPLGGRRQTSTTAARPQARAKFFPARKRRDTLAEARAVDTAFGH